MGVFEFILRLVGILVPPARRKRAKDAADRERPLIDEDEELKRAAEDAKKHAIDES